MNKKIYVLLAVAIIAAVLSYPVIAVNNKSATSASNAGVTDKVSTATTPVGLTLSVTYKNASYVADGIGVRNSGRGTVSLRVPAGKALVDAWIYWKILNTTNGPHDNEIMVNGIRATGKLIGSGPSPCWGPAPGMTFKANIASILSQTYTTGGDFGITVGGINSKITDGRSPWDIFATPAAEDVEIFIIYREPGSLTSIYDGYSEVSGGTATFTVPTGSTMFTSSIGDGQVKFVTPYTKAVTYSVGPTTLQLNTLNGVDPSITSKATIQGSLSDTDTYVLPGGASPAGATLTWTLATDCVSYDVLAFSTAVGVP